MDKLDALFVRAPRQYTDGLTGVIFPYEALYPTILSYNNFHARFLNPEIVERRFRQKLYPSKSFYVYHKRLLREFLRNENHPRWRFLSFYIKKLDPDIVFITHLMPSDFSVTLKTAEIIKKVNPNIFVVSLHNSKQEAEIYIKNSKFIDFCVFGEPEYTLLEVMNYFKKGKLAKDIKKIKGVVFKMGKRIRSTGNSRVETNLDNLPIPNRDLVIKKEWYPPSAFGLVEISRGCLYSCNFCEEKPPLRMRSVESVIREVMSIMKKYKTREFVFMCTSLLHNLAWMKKFCSLIRKKKLKLIWSGYANINQVNERIIRVMKSCGLFAVGIGIESGSVNILEKLGKKKNMEVLRDCKDAVRRARILKENGILWGAGIIFGVLGETLRDVAEDIKIVRLLKPDLFKFQFLVPKLQTVWYRKLYENSKISIDNFHTGHLFFIRKNKELYLRLWRKMEKLSTISEKNFLLKKFLNPRILLLKLVEYFYFSKSFIFTSSNLKV